LARKRVIYEAGGIQFHFFFERGSSSVLHITAKHSTLPTDAPDVFREGITAYDEAHNRFVTTTLRHRLTWNWIDKDQSVFVIAFWRR